MQGVRVWITAYVSDEPQPGLVECALIDARGRRWLFVEKSAVVSADALDAHTLYPQPGVIACEVIERGRDSGESQVARVDTDRPWGIASVEGETRFEVRASALVTWD